MRMFTLGLWICGLGAAIALPSSASVGGVQNLIDVFKCAGQRNFDCVLDKSEQFLVERQKRLMVEADNEVALAEQRGNKDADEKPSSAIETISELLTSIKEIFYKNDFISYFRDAKLDDDEDEEEETALVTSNSDQTHVESSNGNEKSRSMKDEGRGKKKKQKKEKIKAIIKLLIIGAVLYFKIMLLLKILAAHLQIKFLAIALGTFLINAFRFYLEIKKGHHPQKVIYYEHAQHQHHYDTEEDWGAGGASGGYWGRSYDDIKVENDPHVLPYRGHPKLQHEEDSSWF